MSRFKNRFFNGWSHADEAKGDAAPLLPVIAPARQVGFPASIAEFLLVFRLKARRRSALSSDILERALRVVLVTCKNWFTGAGAEARPVRSRKPD
jgi:hypothetical protein